MQNMGTLNAEKPVLLLGLECVRSSSGRCAQPNLTLQTAEARLSKRPVVPSGVEHRRFGRLRSAGLRS
jgi:hypothetical protein